MEMTLCHFQQVYRKRDFNLMKTLVPKYVLH